ncbi:hypothetical protein L210DRAFT_933788 [Boletus edulis BED1]|uniref:Uncharacterized protein n=1 Tax=Boletus edulis BED1 TaxID=1328754 RepID=A0AAD4BKF9_BOLED|nr:hypothetical protein L210DRAFT_933788 [Boletus edulis BED1]
MGAKTYPPIVPRPSQSRRITSLSVATSFSHSHITEEALSEFCASAYELDGDLETEMLHSATDDVWVGHPLAVEGRYGNVLGLEEAVEARGNAATLMEGCVEGDVPTRLTTHTRGGDYETFSASQGVASGGGDAEEGVGKIDEVAVGQTSQPQCYMSSSARHMVYIFHVLCTSDDGMERSLSKSLQQTLLKRSHLDIVINENSFRMIGHRRTWIDTTIQSLDVEDHTRKLDFVHVWLREPIGSLQPPRDQSFNR